MGTKKRKGLIQKDKKKDKDDKKEARAEQVAARSVSSSQTGTGTDSVPQFTRLNLEEVATRQAVLDAIARNIQREREKRCDKDGKRNSVVHSSVDNGESSTISAKSVWSVSGAEQVAELFDQDDDTTGSITDSSTDMETGKEQIITDTEQSLSTLSTGEQNRSLRVTNFCPTTPPFIPQNQDQKDPSLGSSMTRCISNADAGCSDLHYPSSDDDPESASEDSYADVRQTDWRCTAHGTLHPDSISPYRMTIPDHNSLIAMEDSTRPRTDTTLTSSSVHANANGQITDGDAYGHLPIWFLTHPKSLGDPNAQSSSEASDRHVADPRVQGYGSFLMGWSYETAKDTEQHAMWKALWEKQL